MFPNCCNVSLNIFVNARACGIYTAAAHKYSTTLLVIHEPITVIKDNFTCNVKYYTLRFWPFFYALSQSLSDTVPICQLSIPITKHILHLMS